MKKIICIVFTVCISVTLSYSATQSRKNDPKTPNLTGIVTRILEDSGRSGSLTYRGSCTPSGGIDEPFKIDEVASDPFPEKALRKAFANEPALTVKKDSSGLLRIIGGDVQPDLLNLKIHEITLKGKTDPREITATLLGLPEVKIYMRTHHMDFISMSYGLVPPPHGARFTVTLKDTHLSDILDHLVHVFPGVWIYGECEAGDGKKRIYVLFHEFSIKPPS